MKQLVKRRSAMRKAATIAKVKTWKMTEKFKVSAIKNYKKTVSLFPTASCLLGCVKSNI